LADASDFYSAVRRAKTLSAEYLAVCFDFKKGESLPVSRVGPEYFKSQLVCQVFGMHNLQTGRGLMALFSEHFAAKCNLL
jgi:hypothetical protein